MAVYVLPFVDDTKNGLILCDYAEKCILYIIYVKLFCFKRNITTEYRL